MNHPQKPAFSLIEVLLALGVLTLGMIFVAAQFPVGLAASKKVAEDTLSIITAHNTAQTLTLKAPILATTGFLNTADSDVTFLHQPNYRFGGPDYVVDDPLGVLFPAVPDTNFNYATGHAALLQGYIATYETGGTVMPTNLGMIVSPTLDMSDADYYADLDAEGYFTLDPCSATARNLLHDITMQHLATRKYSWAALYSCLDPGYGQSFRFYIFTFRQTDTNQRFAVQDTGSSRIAYPLDADEDRRYPVPWLIILPDPIDPDLDPLFAPDRFDFTEHANATPTEEDDIINLLREGSILVDAINGQICEVMELVMEDTGDNVFVRLRQELTAPLEYFWVFPPAIVDSDVPEFADLQPVVDLTQKVISF